MNEFELIHALTRDVPANAAVVAGPGDDCAVLDLGIPGKWLLYKTDAVVEGVHFLLTTPPEKIGRKALARCLSDMAAMAGRPSAALITLGLPKSYDPAFIQAVYAGFNALARQHGVALAGGETTTNAERIFLSISLLGTVDKEACVLRKGAVEGDALFVSGELGGSIFGHHLDFEPRLEEARWLASNFQIHGMLDLSDGLASDVRHLVDASGLGAEIRTASLPIRRAAKLQGRSETSAKPPLLAALTDGEDYELLFAVPSRDAVRLLDGWKSKFKEVPLTCIGRVIRQPGLHLRDEHGLRPFQVHGYTHFA